ncbi:hypothetical protein JDV09_15345 [Mycobacterium sp. Y57]|uniref:hypothetical protein n=1 Tax=Mycolicibacterium xanthum TaxID=2796469 RepID=UPI001C84AB6B|nr:hypothetical protein [Mycolicibacterium xanthum]MBX7433475.1 hypothetical protein [Mycolicibacterium xanthum]
MSEVALSTADAVLSTADAERLDRRIRLLTNSIGESLSKLYALVEEAKAGQIHVALGYASWTAYVADACKIHVRIDRDQRREIVGWLSGEGMSQRAVADVVGSSVATVNADLGVQNRTPEPDAGNPVSELVDAVVDEARQQGDTSDENIARIVADAFDGDQKTTGVDGKQYPQKPRNPKPDPSPATFARLMCRLAKLNRIASECSDIAEALNFNADVNWCGLVYTPTEQHDSAAALADGLVAAADRIAKAVSK